MAEMMTPIVNISRFDGVLGTSKGAMWINQSDSAPIAEQLTKGKARGMSWHLVVYQEAQSLVVVQKSSENSKKQLRLPFLYIQSFFKKKFQLDRIFQPHKF